MTKEEIAHDERIWKLQESLKTTPLSAFMASDLESLLKIRRLDRYGFGPCDDDLKLLEERIAAYRKKKPNPPKHSL